MLRSDTLQRPSARRQECLPLHFPGKLLLETGSGPNPGRPFLLHNKTAKNSLSVRATLRGFVVRKIGGISPGSTGGEPIRPHQRQALHPRFAFAGGVWGKLSATPRSARRCRKTARQCSSSAPGWRPGWPPNSRRRITTQKARPVPNGTGLVLLGVCTRQGGDQARPVQSSPWLSLVYSWALVASVMS